MGMKSKLYLQIILLTYYMIVEKCLCRLVSCKACSYTVLSEKSLKAKLWQETLLILEFARIAQPPVLHNLSICLTNISNTTTDHKRSFISEMKWARLQSLFWNANDSNAKLTISITSSVSLWETLLLKYVNAWQR